MRKFAFLAAALAASLIVLPASAQFTGGVRVASGDVTGDGAATGAGPHIKVFDGSGGTLLIGRGSYELTKYTVSSQNVSDGGGGPGTALLNFATAADARASRNALARSSDASLDIGDGQVIVFTGLEVVETKSDDMSLSLNFEKYKTTSR